MRALVSFQAVQKELSQETLVQRESRAEETAAIVLTSRTYTELFGERWEAFGRKVPARYNHWLKSNEAPSLEELALCINVPALAESFAGYVLRKAQKKEREEWETTFADPSFQNVVRLFLNQKVFERKSEITLHEGQQGFLTRIAFDYFLRQHGAKGGRDIGHEAVSKMKKLHSQGLPPEEVLNAVQEMLDRGFEELWGKISDLAGRTRFPDQQLSKGGLLGWNPLLNEDW